jgi:hypothetical protein
MWCECAVLRFTLLSHRIRLLRHPSYVNRGVLALWDQQQYWGYFSALKAKINVTWFLREPRYEINENVTFSYNLYLVIGSIRPWLAGQMESCDSHANGSLGAKLHNTVHRYWIGFVDSLVKIAHKLTQRGSVSTTFFKLWLMDWWKQWSLFYMLSYLKYQRSDLYSTAVVVLAAYGDAYWECVMQTDDEKDPHALHWRT